MSAAATTPDLGRALVAAVLDQLAADPESAARLAAALGPHLGNTEAERAGAYTVATLAAELDVSEKTIRGAIARGELLARRTGRRYVIDAQAVAEWTSPGEPRAPRGSGERHRRRSSGRLARTARPAAAAFARLADGAAGDE